MLQEKTALAQGSVLQGRNGTRYVVEGLLGQGGFSAVYLVRERNNKEKLFALKELINPDARERERFTFEAELLTRLRHKALPHIYEVFEDAKQQRVYMVMDYIKGKDLRTLHEEQPGKHFSLPVALTLMEAIVDAAQYLHSQVPPIVHRDIKPANIIVPAGSNEAVLVDFGIAKEYTEDKTTNVFRYGTPGYAALEQYGYGTNPRTDIYALGATFYTLVTGKVPTDALTRSVEIAHGDPLKLVHQLSPIIPLAVSRVVERAMKLRSEDRYETVEEFWQELTAAALEKSHTGPIEHFPHTPLPFVVTQDDIRKPVVASPRPVAVSPSARKTTIHRERDTRRQRWIVFLVIIALIIGVGGVDAFLALTLGHSHSSSNAKPQVTKTVQVQKKFAVAGCPLPPFLPKEPVSPVDVQMRPAYQGVISNNVASVSTNDAKAPLCLLDVQQQGNKITGEFSGLNFISTFSGVVTQDTIHFTVKIGDDKIYSFTGGIRSGGDMGGAYTILNSQGENLGEGGAWEVVPAKLVDATGTATTS